MQRSSLVKVLLLFTLQQDGYQLVLAAFVGCVPYISRLTFTIVKLLLVLL